jgi:hypothetical protein
MNYKLIKGKRKDSQIVLVEAINQIFVIKEKKNNGKFYLKCHFKSCNAKGIIEKDQFIECDEVAHQNHEYSVDQYLVYLEFIEELRKCSTNYGESLKITFDEVYTRLVLLNFNFLFLYLHFSL